MVKMSNKWININEMRSMWKKYTDIEVINVLKDGNWEWHIKDGDVRAHTRGAVRAEAGMLNRMISFPEYVKRYHGEDIQQ